MRSHLLIFLVFQGFISFGLGKNTATYSHPKLTADTPLIYDILEKKVIAKLNATLRSEDLLVSADTIIWDKNRSLLLAKDQVILTIRGMRMLCNELELNLTTGNYSAKDIKTGIYPWSIEALSLSKANYEVNATATKLINREYGLGNFRPSLNFATLNHDDNQSLLKSGLGIVRSGKIPIGIIPPLSLSTEEKETALNLNFKAGKKANLGWYVGKGINWQVKQINTNATITHYLTRGTLIAPSLKYYSNEPDWVHSFIDFGWINDQGGMGLDRRQLLFSKQRSYLDGTLLYHSENSIRIAGQVEYESDSEINRDFRVENFSSGQWNDHFLEVAYERPWGGISSLQRWQVNQHEALIERKPTLRIETAPLYWSPLSSYHTSFFEYSDLRARNSFGNKVQDVEKLDFGIYSFRPIRLMNGVSMTPSITGRQQFFEIDHLNPSRTWLEFGNELRLHAHADYKFENRIWEISGIRHSMDFILNYSQSHASNEKNLNDVPRLEFSEYQLNLEPINLFDIVESDFMQEVKTFRLDWYNYLSTKVKDNYKEMLSLRISQDLWNEAQLDRNLTHSTFIKAEFSPARWLSFRGQVKTNTHQSKEITVISASIRDGMDSSYQISRVNYTNFNSNWGFSASKNISYAQKLGFFISYDTDTRKIPYWRANYQLKDSNSLTYNFSISERKGTLREDELNYSFTLGIFSF